MRPIVNMPDEDRATAIGNMRKKLIKIARVIPEISCRTDRQTDRQTYRQKHSSQYFAADLVGEVTYEYNAVGFPVPLPRHHLSNDDCLEDKREDYQNCSVLCCVRLLCSMVCTHTWAVHTCEYWFRFSFCAFFRFSILCVFFWFSLDYFVPVLLSFVVLGLVSSVLCKRLRNDLFCVELDVKA